MNNLFKGCLGCLGLLVAFALLVGGCTAFFDVDSGEEVTTEEQTTEKVTAPTTTAIVNKEQTSLSHGLIAATVNRVVDGNTLKVTIDDKEETVRLILVDTPEIKHPQKGVQLFGSEASAFTTEQ